MKQKIIDYLDQIPKCWRSRRLRDYPEYVGYLNELYPDYDLSYQIQFLFQGLEKQPSCQICHKPVSKPLHNQTCSRACRDLYKKQTGAFEQAQQKAKQTNLIKYGFENPMSNPDMQERRVNTLIEMYGEKVSPRTRERAKDRAHALNKNGRRTLKRKYGVDNPGQLPDHREKCLATTRKKYGVDHYTQTEEYQITHKNKRLGLWDRYSPPEIEILNLHNPKLDQANQRIEFLCTQCQKNQSVASETFKWRVHQTGTPCGECSNLNKGSLKEQQLADYVSGLVDIERNVRGLIGRQELDILVPDHNLAIEFNGLFWHNDLRLPKDYHQDKYRACWQQGIKLITVFEDEWDHKTDIVKSRIRNALELAPNKVAARKCHVEIIDTRTAKKFINQHHIQGYTPSKIKLGLFCEDHLLGVMTFSSLTKSKGHILNDNHWEMSRFCIHQDWQVVGGASKLFSEFVRTNNPEMVLSFSDLRWGDGRVYSNLGFEYHYDTEPGYWYFNQREGKRIHRYALRKNKDDDQGLTEYENRLQQGYLRVWDCGHAKWIWKE